MKPNILGRFAIISAAILWLSACASLTEHHLYEGKERPQEELLVVEIPHLLEVMTVNGKALANSGGKLLGNNDQKLYLLPGRYAIDAFYKQFWDNNIESHTVVRSQPVTFVVEGKAGETVTLDFERPQRLPEAEKLAKNFSGWTLNLATDVKTPTQATTAKRPTILASLQNDHTAADTTDIVAPLQDHRPEQDLVLRLKALWKVASDEEKREFLLWISE